MPASRLGLVPFRPPLSSAGHPSLPGTSSELLFLVAEGLIGVTHPPPSAVGHGGGF